MDSKKRRNSNKYNLEELVGLNIPCARILARHEGGSEASKASADMAAGLETVLVLGKGARVMITRNVRIVHGTRRCSIRTIQSSLIFPHRQL
ncbi:hypothetical protein F5888DRAFT_1739130, partial [Russula emetica]